MAKSKKQLHEGIRQRFMLPIIKALTDAGEEVLRTASNEISIPCLDEEGNDEFIVISFKVPTGCREDGEAYDGYSKAEAYTMRAKEAEEKQKKAEEKKKAKIEKDKKIREERAKAKAEREKAKGGTEG